MKTFYVLSIVFLCLLDQANAFEMLTDGYFIEDYAQYSSTSLSMHMVFDNSGNLYINHHNKGLVMKVDSKHQPSVHATGFGNLFGITWGGGTGYGNYLYVTQSEGTSSDKIYRVDLEGNISNFATMGSPSHSPTVLAIDTLGNYGNKMYVGTGAMDRLCSVSTSGNVSLFSSWPGWTNGGSVYGLEFDTTGKYGGKLFAGTSFRSSDSDISGLFAIEPDGSATRFGDDIVAVGTIGFDKTGKYFDGDMFVFGKDDFSSTSTLWRIMADGSSEEFMSGIRSFTFGDDGAMYVSNYNSSTSKVNISRITPEPATLLFLGIGGLILRRNKKNDL